eukprot:6177083-Pleurochrysis_carterae.AAC.1
MAACATRISRAAPVDATQFVRTLPKQHVCTTCGAREVAGCWRTPQQSFFAENWALLPCTIHRVSHMHLGMYFSPPGRFNLQSRVMSSLLQQAYASVCDASMLLLSVWRLSAIFHCSYLHKNLKQPLTSSLLPLAYAFPNRGCTQAATDSDRATDWLKTQ